MSMTELPSRDGSSTALNAEVPCGTRRSTVRSSTHVGVTAAGRKRSNAARSMSIGNRSRRRSGPDNGACSTAFAGCSTPSTITRTVEPATRRGDAEGDTDTLATPAVGVGPDADTVGAEATSLRAPHATSRRPTSTRDRTALRLRGARAAAAREILSDPQLHDLAYERPGKWFVQREPRRRDAGEIPRELFRVARLRSTQHVQADPITHEREVDQATVMRVIGHAIADRFRRRGRRILDDLSQLPQRRSRRGGRRGDVRAYLG